MSKSSNPGLTVRGHEAPRQVTLQLTVPAAARAAAERLARGYARRPREVVLAALVNDLAAAQERSGSWEYERVTSWLGSHVWSVEPIAAPRPTDREP